VRRDREGDLPGSPPEAFQTWNQHRSEHLPHSNPGIENQAMNRTFELPQEFLDQYLDHFELAAMMSAVFGVEVSEGVMLSLVAAGKTPVAVNLLPLCGLPLIVWKRSEIAAWAAIGFALPQAVIELENRVRGDLEAAGVTVRDIKPLHPAELN